MHLKTWNKGSSIRGVVNGKTDFLRSLQIGDYFIVKDASERISFFSLIRHVRKDQSGYKLKAARIANLKYEIERIG